MIPASVTGTPGSKLRQEMTFTQKLDGRGVVHPLPPPPLSVEQVLKNAEKSFMRLQTGKTVIQAPVT
jgi:hypothetical protein